MWTPGTFQVNFLKCKPSNFTISLRHRYNQHYWLDIWLTVSRLTFFLIIHIITFFWRKKPSLWLVFLHTMNRLVTPILCAVFILIRVLKSTANQQGNFHRDSKHQHANFVKNGSTVLDVPMITSTAFHDDLDCAFECLTHDQCISYNSAVFPDADGKFECQILATDKYRSSKNLRSSKEFNHYSIMVSRFK